MFFSTLRFYVRKESVIDITKQVQDIVNKSGFEKGIVVLFVKGSTAGLSTMEFEDGLKHDIYKALERVAPSDAYYKHHEKWHDDNGRSHVRATIIGQSLTIPFMNKQLMLGTWQQIVLFNFDTRHREREVVVIVQG